jgi:glycosyltransferase involved in cell wall biosynthesis
MSKRNRKPKIALIGPYPPPYGGISVHIQRMAAHLEAEDIEYVIHDDSGTEKNEKNVICINDLKRWLPKYFFFAKEDIIHYHTPSWILRIIFGLMSFLGKKTIISIHGESLNDSLKDGGWFRKKAIIFALKHTSFIIADNQNIKKLVLSVGVSPSKVEVIPAFIPPMVKEEDFEKVPGCVREFIDSHKPIISGNAFQISFYKGMDLYGLDLCIELISNLQKYYPNIGLVFCLPNIGDYEYFKKLQQQIKQKKIENNILFITEPLPEVYPIWIKSDIFVRPTCTDGDALSIREAMYFKVPVVTSDAVPRPESILLFKNRDVQDFIEKTKKVLNNYEEYKNRTKQLDSDSGFDKILEVYDELAK